MDVIAMHQAGFTQAVASLGTSFTEGQAAVIKRYVKRVLLSYDSDGAGVKAAMRNIGILRDAGLTGKVVNLEPFKDPDEFMKNLGPEEFQKRLDNAENSFFYQIRQMEKDYRMDDPASRSDLYHEIARRLCSFSDEMERDSYIKAMAERYFIDVDMLRREVAAYGNVVSTEEASRPRTRADTEVADNPASGLALNNLTKSAPAGEGIRPRTQMKNGGKRLSVQDKARLRNEQLLLTFVSDDPGLYPQIRDYISAEDFTEGVPRMAAEKYFAMLEREMGDKLAAASGNSARPHSSPGTVVAMFEEEEEQRQAAQLFETRLSGITQEELEKALRDVLCAIKRSSIQRMSADLSDPSSLAKLMQAKRELAVLRQLPLTLSSLE